MIKKQATKEPTDADVDKWEKRYCELMYLRSQIESECEVSEDIYLQKQKQFIQDIAALTNNKKGK